MPSTTPSPPSTPISSPTTSNREYVLVGTSDLCWYGYFKEDTCYWSDWCNSFADAITSKLKEDPEEETIEEFVKKADSRFPIYRLPGPISIDTHPEYFI